MPAARHVAVHERVGSRPDVEHAERSCRVAAARSRRDDPRGHLDLRHSRSTSPSYDKPSANTPVLATSDTSHTRSRPIPARTDALHRAHRPPRTGPGPQRRRRRSPTEAPGQPPGSRTVRTIMEQKRQPRCRTALGSLKRREQERLPANFRIPRIRQSGLHCPFRPRRQRGQRSTRRLVSRDCRTAGAFQDRVDSAARKRPPAAVCGLITRPHLRTRRRNCRQIEKEHSNRESRICRRGRPAPGRPASPAARRSSTPPDARGCPPSRS